MNLTTLNFLFSSFYLLLPCILITVLDIQSQLGVNLKGEPFIYLTQLQIITFFIVNLIPFILPSGIKKNIVDDINNIKSPRPTFVVLSYVFLLVFVIQVLKLAPHLFLAVTRDAKYLYQLNEIGYIFTISFKLSIFFCCFYIISNYKNKFFYLAVFLIFLMILSILSEARFFLLFALTPILICLRVSKFRCFIIFLTIFVLRVLLNDSYKFDGTSEWFSNILFGDVLNRLVGSYVVYQFAPDLDLEQVAKQILTTIPFLSYLGQGIFNTQPIEGEVNNLVEDNLGFSGVASTPYNDFIYSVPVSVSAIFICILFYVLSKKFIKGYSGTALAFYLSACTSIVSLYHMGMSSFINLFFRDFLVYVFLFHLAYPLTNRVAKQ
jgi:hypothetical protein